MKKKINKDYSGKKKKKIHKKKNHVRKHCGNPKYFNEKNYRTKFSISSILKKNSQIIF
jgi:hypothetical protein